MFLVFVLDVVGFAAYDREGWSVDAVRPINRAKLAPVCLRGVSLAAVCLQNAKSSADERA